MNIGTATKGRRWEKVSECSKSIVVGVGRDGGSAILLRRWGLSIITAHLQVSVL